MTGGKTEQSAYTTNIGDLAVISVCLVAPSLVLSPWSDMANFTDFPEYYGAAKLLTSGHFRDVYDIQTLGRVQNDVYPALSGRVIPLFLLPVLVWCLAPLAWLPFQVSLVVWTLFLCGALLTSFVLVARILGLNRRQRLWAAVLLGTSGPCLECIRLGQLGPLFLFGLMLWSYGMVNRKSLLSACGQAVFFLKPHIMLPLMIFDVGAGSFGVLLRTILIGATGTLCVLLMGGPATFWAYEQEIFSPSGRVYMGSITGPTLRGQLLRLKLPVTDGQIDMVSYAVYSAVLVATYFIARRYARQNHALFAMSTVVIPLSLAYVTHLQNYDLVLLFPGLLAPFALNRATSVMKAQKIVAALLILLLSLPVYILVHYVYVLPGGLVNPFFIGVSIWAVTSFFALRDSTVVETNTAADNAENPD
jgi:hypothetical protein